MQEDTEAPAATTVQTATVGTPPALPDMLPNVSPSVGVLSSVSAVLVALLWVRRKFSRDGLEVTKDASEGKLLITLATERDKAMESAREAWRSRADDAKQIGQLSSDVAHLTKTNEGLTSELTVLRSEVRELKDMVNLLLPIQNLGLSPAALRAALLALAAQPVPPTPVVPIV